MPILVAFKMPRVIIGHRQFANTLFDVVQQAMKFIVSYISVVFESDGSIQRKERFGSPLLHNKLVAKGFYLINAIEKYGGDLIRIRRALLDYPEILYGVHESRGGVMATFTQKQPYSPVSGASAELLCLLQLTRSQSGLQVGENTDKKAKPKKIAVSWLRQLKESDLAELRDVAKTGGYHFTNILNQPLNPI